MISFYKKFKKIFVILLFLIEVSVFLCGHYVAAYTILNPLGSGSTLGGTLTNFLTLFFIIVALTLFIIIIYAGYTYITAAGNPEKVKRAQNTLVGAIIGFAIIVLAGIIVQIIDFNLGVTNPVPITMLSSPVYAACTTASCILGTPGISTNGNLSNNDLNQSISNFIDFAVVIATLVSLVFIIIGGYKYITSQGDPQKAASARRTIIFAMIGLIFVLASWFLVNMAAGLFGLNVQNTIVY